MSAKLTRRQFLAGVGAVGASALLGNNAAAETGSVVGQQIFFPRIQNYTRSDRLNLITVVCDSLRYDHVGFMGNPWIRTPNLDAFAAQAVVFDKAHVGGFPTLLHRAELFTGRWMYTTIGWEDLPAGETHVARLLTDAGYLTGIVFDNWLLKDEGRSYERGFGSWEWIRGQITDRYRVTPVQPPLPADPSKLRHGASDITQYLRNVGARQSEDDYFPAQTMRAAIAWLERTHKAGPFYLHIDSYDPHEPWDPPRPYVDLYDPGYVGEEVIYPAYAPPTYLSPAELRHMRALYAAEVTMVDRWLGELFAAIDRLGLAQNTAVMLMSDHGFLLGEHNAVGKSWDEGSITFAYSLWQELAHVVLMARLPGVAPRRSKALAQAADIAPTLLDLAGVERPANLHGVSLVPLLRTATGEPEPVLRSAAVASRTLLAPLNTRPTITVSDGDWTLIHGGAHASGGLYHLADDPQQQIDLLSQQNEMASALHAYLIDFLENLGLPEERIAPWRPATRQSVL